MLEKLSKEALINFRKGNDEKLTDEEKRILKYFLRKELGRLKQDMLDVKKSYERAIKWKQPLKDNMKINWEYVDFSNKDHVLSLIPLLKRKENLCSDLGCILYDLKNLIDRTEFTDRQKEVLDLWMQDIPISGDHSKGNRNIAKELGISQQSVTKALNRATDRICKTYIEQYEDWYYLNVEKGTYKKCSKCGEIKLIQRFDKNGSKGYKSVCKECRKKS